MRDQLLRTIGVAFGNDGTNARRASLALHNPSGIACEHQQGDIGMSSFKARAASSPFITGMDKSRIMSSGVTS